MLGRGGSVFCLVLDGHRTASTRACQAGSSQRQQPAKRQEVSERGNGYVSWGYSRQQYAPSDIHVSQPALGNDFTLGQVAGRDFPANVQETLGSITSLEFTNPQENIRIGRYLNAEKTFAIEFSLDHSKYNTNPNQTVAVSGTVATGTPPINGSMVLNPDNFNYNLHNGLNHIMVNAVGLHHLYGLENQPGDLQLISRVGAGILLPHADNVIFGNPNQVGLRVAAGGAALPGCGGSFPVDVRAGSVYGLHC